MRYREGKKMGIPYLNRYICDNCIYSVKKKSLWTLRGKVLAVDIMVYLYKYHSEGVLLENLYHMISLFRYYKIVPIFVFDGRPPPEKAELLKKRKEEKWDAEEKYNILKQRLSTTLEEEVIAEIQSNMSVLKKRFTRLNAHILDKVKSLMDAYGARYIIADGEADPLCAKLVIRKKAYACLSEDMDQFLYGCPRVLRNINLQESTVVLYNLKEILRELELSFNEFKEICIVSGTDYNRSSKINLHKTLKYFVRYKKSDIKGFYQWLQLKTNYITDFASLQKIFKMFDLSNIIVPKLRLENTSVDSEALKELLIPEGFIFMDS